MSLKIELTGRDAVKAAFRDLVPYLQRRVVTEVATSVFNDVRQQASRHNKSGRFVNAVRMTRFGDGGFRVWFDESYAPHAKYVINGTRPHTIRPKKEGGVLRFFSKSGGVVFSKFCRHPGYKGDPIIHRAFQNAVRHFAAAVAKLRGRVR